MWNFLFVCLFLLPLEPNRYNRTRQLAFVLKGIIIIIIIIIKIGLEIRSNLLTHNVLKQHLLEAGVMSCSSSSYYEKFCKVLGEHMRDNLNNLKSY